VRIETTRITDDLDGTDGAHTHRIVLDSLAVEIDLSQANAARLYDLLAPYLDAGRRIGSPLARPAGGPAPAQIRNWWADQAPGNGLPSFVARGAIPAAVLRAWMARDQTPAAPPQRRTRRR
jgi:hypothetical protein